MRLTTDDIWAADLLMTEPILQNPGNNSVYVQWFTSGEGDNHSVLLYENGPGSEPSRVIKANSVKMERLRGGNKESNCNNASISQDIYKHIALVEDLPANEGRSVNRVLYKIESDGRRSRMYSLAANPSQGTDVKILLTSDHQIKKMCAANIEKVLDTVGRVDAVWCAGDIVDVSDRAYDWFYADNAFIRVMTGKAESNVNGKVYKGAPILQYAPIYTAIGNHDVMGVYSADGDLSVQFNGPIPREVAIKRITGKEPTDTKTFTEKEEAEIQDASYNTITYEQMFELPEESGTRKWYAKSIGDVRLISLDVSRVWRLPNLGMIGKYTEWPGLIENTYGYGDFIFERVDSDSEQIKFLEKELKSDDFQNAKYKAVMFHGEAHSLGGNQIPAFTDPVASTVVDPVTGLKMVTYDYPIDKDYISTVIEPLLEENNTDLLFNAHSHLWNRFVTAGGMNVLQTSNVGNNYGGYLDSSREQYPSALNRGDTYSAIASAWNADNYIIKGDPYGLDPVEPTETELPGGMPFLASDSVTAFSVLDTKKGMVESYYYDTAKPDSEVVLFDTFKISREE